MNCLRLVQNKCCLLVIPPQFRVKVIHKKTFGQNIDVYLTVIISYVVIQWFCSGLSIVKITTTEEKARIDNTSIVLQIKRNLFITKHRQRSLWEFKKKTTLFAGFFSKSSQHESCCKSYPEVATRKCVWHCNHGSDT